MEEKTCKSNAENFIELFNELTEEQQSSILKLLRVMNKKPSLKEDWTS